MSKKPRFRIPFKIQHVKESQTILKSARTALIKLFHHSGGNGIEKCVSY